MLRLATLFVVFSVCLVARAGDCPPSSPISLHSDEPLHVQVFLDNTPAVASALQLYAGDKLVYSVITGKDARVRLGLLPVGKYRIVIPRKGTLDIVVLAQKSGLNGPLISCSYSQNRSTNGSQAKRW